MSTYLPTTPAAPRTADIHLTDITYTADKTPTLTIPQLTLTPGITAIIGPKGQGKQRSSTSSPPSPRGERHPNHGRNNSTHHAQPRRRIGTRPRHTARPHWVRAHLL